MVADGDDRPGGDPVEPTPITSPSTAAALLAVAVGTALVELARTGHGRVVAVVAFGALLLAVLDAAAGLLGER